jgi:ATP-dependent Zn protease
VIRSPRSRASTLEEVAYHEAGHVVGGHRLGVELASVDILRDGEGGNGHTVFNVPPWFRPGANLDDRRRRYAEAVVTTFLAGPIAEARVAGFPNLQGSGYDLDAVAREWLRLLEPPKRYEVRLKELTARAEALVEENWPAIERLAQALLERRRLTGAEALQLL